MREYSDAVKERNRGMFFHKCDGCPLAGKTGEHVRMMCRTCGDTHSRKPKGWVRLDFAKYPEDGVSR